MIAYKDYNGCLIMPRVSKLPCHLGNYIVSWTNLPQKVLLLYRVPYFFSPDLLYRKGLGPGTRQEYCKADKVIIIYKQSSRNLDKTLIAEYK